MLTLLPTAVACGKVILLGEHSVVYGRPALAAGLARGLTLHARPLTETSAPIELAIPSWDLDLRLTPDNEHPVARACLEVLAHCDGPVTGWRIEGEARIPCRAGLGSSAALSVALARLALGAHASNGEADTEAVIEASLVGERVFHGQPSGIDNAVAARGGVVAFERGAPVEHVELASPLDLVVMPSGVPRQTATLVTGVRERRERLPAVVEPIIDGLAALVHQGRGALESGELGRLAELFDIAHALLNALGTGHPALDQLYWSAREHGALAAKLTGAGGGGCAIALCTSAADAAGVLAGLRQRFPELAASPRTAPFAIEVETGAHA